MTRIKVKIKSLKVPKSSYANLEELPAYVRRRKKNLLKAIGVEGENLLKAEARRVSTFGTLERSIQHRIVFGDSVVIYSDLEYSNIALETGRKPGKMPPYKAIEMWAVKKGLGKNVGYAVAKKIAKSGTNLHIHQAPKRVTRTVKVMDRKLPRLIKQHLFDDK